MNKKKLIAILISFVGLAIVIILFWPKSKPPKETTVLILLDVTDEYLRNDKLFFDALKQVFEVIDVDTINNFSNGGTIILQTLNDLSDSPQKKIKLLSYDDGWFGKPELDRIDEIKKIFFDTKLSLQNLLNNSKWNKDHSRIYRPLCANLNELANIKTKRIVILFTDLLENSELFSFYGTSNRKKIQGYIKNISYADSILSATSGCSFPILSEIEINCVTIRTPSNDSLVNLAQVFWSKLFNYKKITKFRISSNLNLH